MKLIVLITTLIAMVFGHVHSAQATLNVPHIRQWECIHHWETYGHRDPEAWHLATGNGYYGGLQMEASWTRYAPRWMRRHGLPNNWHPRWQMWVAEQVYATRGFSPWPHTARLCGLI